MFHRLSKPTRLAKPSKPSKPSKPNKMGEEMVTLQTASGNKFTLTLEASKFSEFISTVIDDSGESDENIPIISISDDTLKHIIIYCEYHKEHPPENSYPKFATGKDISSYVCEFDNSWIDKDEEIICNIMMAANYLAIKDIITLCAFKLASILHGTPVEKMREIFDIKNDFTPEEEKMVREEM